MSSRVALALVVCLLPLAAAPSHGQERAIQPAVPEASDRGVIERARVLKRPEYPDDPAAAAVEGTVAVRVLIAANGELVSARAVDGPEELRDAAIQAAKAWEFTSSTDPDNLSGFVLFRFAPGKQFAEILGLREQEVAQASPPREAPAPAASTSRPTRAPAVARPTPARDPKRAAGAQPKREEPGRPAAAARRAAAAAPERVSTGALLGKAERRVAPSYPPAAANARVEGAVVVEVLLDEAGKVAEARAVSGHLLLREAAVNAAREWSFKPTLVSGKPVKVISTLIFNFKR